MSEPAASPSSSSSSARAAVLAGAATVLGAALFVVTIRQVGWADVVAGVAAVGWWFLLILALAGVRFVARARAWVACARDGRTSALSLRAALGAMLAGDALGNLTPLGLLASEPTKILLARRHLPAEASVSTVAAENVFYTTSVLIVLLTGTLVFVQRASLPPPLALGAQGILGAALAGLAVTFWASRRRPAVVSTVTAWGSRLLGRGAQAPERLRDIELRFYELLAWPLPRLLRVGGWYAVFHVAAVLEVYAVLRLVPGGGNATLVDAFLLETAGRLIIVVFKFVPYRLGVDEAGTALVARALLLSPTVGVTLALIRRLRILAWNAVGLILLARTR